MPTEDTRDREKAKKSIINRPTNPLFPFDKAVYKKLKQLYDEVYPIDTFESFFSMNAKAHQGKIILPAISVYRLADYTVSTEMINDWAVRSGFRRTVSGRDEFTDRRVAVHTLPVTLTYQIDIWATRRDVAEGITAELLLEFKERPYVKVKVQDSGDEARLVEFDFQVDDNVMDNSSITEFDDTGRFYRLTLNALMPSAAITRVDIFKRVDKEVINFEDLVPDIEKKEKENINDITHSPETLYVKNGIDKYGNLINTDDKGN